MDERSAPDRRSVLTGATVSAGLAAWPALAVPRKAKPTEPEPARLFTEGALAKNVLAQKFHVPAPPLVWPNNVTLRGYDNLKTTLDAYRGKTLVVSLWAEWCTPCLNEMPGLAYLESRTRSDAFQILPILTSSERYTRPEQAKPLLAKLHAKDLPILMDKRDRLVGVLGRGPESPRGALPCNLLIDPQGRIRGRQIGGEIFKDADGKTHSLWGSSAGLAFVKALAAGALV